MFFETYAGKVTAAKGFKYDALKREHEELQRRYETLRFENDCLREAIERLKDPTRQGDKT